MADAERLAAYAEEVLGPPATWRPAPPGYPEGLALCVIDAIWSMGVRYAAVENVVDCYRRSRRAEGGDPHLDGAFELLQHYERIGGPERFATEMKNRQRVSTRPGAVLKAAAIYQAALGLQGAGIQTCEELRAAATGAGEARVKGVWLAVPGQGSGISWRYLLMLAGLPGVKPDRMIRRLVARALGLPDVAPDAAVCLVTKAAELLAVSSTALDHEVWRHERKRRRRRRPDVAE
ncbi:hypothetical protein GKC29_17430 [Micromonospora sp. WMMC415]|uniref:hypothetical protein n=1 Tax=Micromonospora sp. WMMC415 TaxID=2675222 RepID=UPI0012B4CAEE|nr:hypothetical protein [Micromonospora sp. WMMC415]QGN48445.1 hypothetical protein GKC29_17430 [Micromonospora sp. WMMC415]